MRDSPKDLASPDLWDVTAYKSQLTRAVTGRAALATADNTIVSMFGGDHVNT